MAERVGRETLVATQLIDSWRERHWPPSNMKSVGVLPIYIGDHAAVSAFSETLRVAMESVSDHVMDQCGGRVPRWLRVPKIVFGAERVNLVEATAKSSVRFDSVAMLPTRCGEFREQDLESVKSWLDKHPGKELVAHKPFKDLRAYVYVKGEVRPRRFRYYTSGLVIGAQMGEGVKVQDHRGDIRVRRCDALASTLAVSGSGWTIYVPRD